MRNKKFGGANGKGYYIALILCAAAIGISGYLYYSNANKQQQQLGGQEAPVAATSPADEQDLPVVATQPQVQDTEATKPTVDITNKSLQTVSPVQGQIISMYAMDNLSYNATTRDWRVHNGMDIAAEEGSAVCAAADGTVYTVYEDETLGTTVVIRHADGFVTQYSSLAKEVSVAPGDTVTLGQQIGTVGNTALLENAVGSHVHFSVSCNDVPVDPAKFLNQA